MDEINSATESLKKLSNAMKPQPISSNSEITISVREYAHLKDIETRFTIIREQMLHAEYCPIHTQIILGIENEYKEPEMRIKNFALDELVIPPLLKKKMNIPEEKKEGE